MTDPKSAGDGGEVKRYDPVIVGLPNENLPQQVNLAFHPKGSVVRYDDHAAALAEAKADTDRIDLLGRLCGGWNVRVETGGGYVLIQSVGVEHQPHLDIRGAIAIDQVIDASETDAHFESIYKQQAEAAEAKSRELTNLLADAEHRAGKAESEIARLRARVEEVEAEAERWKLTCEAHCVVIADTELERNEARYVAAEMYDLWWAYQHADRGAQAAEVDAEWTAMVKRWHDLEETADAAFRSPAPQPIDPAIFESRPLTAEQMFTHYGPGLVETQPAAESEPSEVDILRALDRSATRKRLDMEAEIRDLSNGVEWWKSIVNDRAIEAGYLLAEDGYWSEPNLCDTALHDFLKRLAADASRSPEATPSAAAAFDMRDALADIVTWSDLYPENPARAVVKTKYIERGDEALSRFNEAARAAREAGSDE